MGFFVVGWRVWDIKTTIQTKQIVNIQRKKDSIFKYVTRKYFRSSFFLNSIRDKLDFFGIIIIIINITVAKICYFILITKGFLF